MEIKPIAYIENDFCDKFAIPRQSGISSIISRIVFAKEYSDENAVRGLEEFSHIWLIWGFSENAGREHPLTVRPPRLGGNTRLGVFATRSPYRPNNLGLSCVKLEKIEYDAKRHPVITVSGADLLNGTPIYDIKPYIKYTDCMTEAVSGFADTHEFNMLSVTFGEGTLENIPKEKRDTLMTILSNDPRPAYHTDSERVYGFRFAGFEIKFKVKGSALSVISIDDER